MTDRPRLLVVADAVAPTGFARLSENLIRRLAHAFEIHQVGLNYVGPPRTGLWTLYSGGVDDRGQYAYGADETRRWIERLRPDLVLFINDLGVIREYSLALADAGNACGYAAYFPIDSDPLEPELFGPVARFCDRLITYTEFGRSQIAEVSRRFPDIEGADCVEIIPHGIDLGTFRSLCGYSAAELAGSLKAARRSLFPEAAHLDGAFIVLNANRNQPRKRIDLTMEGFARFAEGKPDSVLLYLHMGREDAGWNLTVMARRLGISKRLILSTTGTHSPAVTVEKLNLIYNACDVGINTATAEGWGLCAFEHAAAGRPQVITRLGTQTEMWEGAALLLEPRFSVTAERSLIRTYFTTPGDVAAALESLYTNPSYRHEVGARCLARARDPLYSWDAIAGRWKDLLEGLLADRGRRAATRATSE